MSSLFELNSRSFGRLLWKEFRQFRALILTLLVAGLLLQVGMLAMSGYGMLPVLLSAGVIPILCGLAIAATMFAGEHEAGTFLGLRALPASQFQIVLAKFAVAVAGALASFGALWLLVFALRDRLIGPEHDLITSAELGTWLFSSLGTLVEILIAGAWISLKERRVLPALIKSGAVVAAIRVLAVGTAMLVCSGRFTSIEATDRAILWTTIAVRALAFASIGVALFFDLARWYRGEGPGQRNSWLPWVHLARPAVSTICGPVQPGVIRRLIWLQLRYIGWWVGIPVLLATTSALMAIFRIAEPTQYTELALGLAMWSTVLLGALSFAAANANRSFLAQVGGSPRGVWISQCALPSAAAVAAICIGGLARREFFGSSFPDYAFNLLMPVLASFSWSLLVSMQSRSPITAIAKSVAAMVGISLVFNFVHRCQLPVGWTLALAGLITLYPLAEAWWRAPAWLNGTDSSRWRWPAIRLGLASLAILFGLWRIEAGVPYYSNLAIAIALNGGEVPETASYDKVRRLAQQVDANFRSSIAKHGINYRFPYVVEDIHVGQDVVHDWIESSKIELNQLMELPYQDLVIQAFAIEPDSDIWQIRRAAFTETQLDLFFSAAFSDAVRQSNLEQAEQLLLHNPMVADPVLVARWAWLPENNSLRLRRVIRSLEAMGDPWESIERQSSARVFAGNWENLRRTRGVNVVDRWADAMQKQRQDRKQRSAAIESSTILQEYSNQVQQGVPVYRLVSDVCTVEPSREPDDSTFKSYLTKLGLRLMQRRVLIVQLAAIAWARDHQGNLPDSLSSLVDDYVTKIPLDPWTGKPFVFEPNADASIPHKFLWVPLKSNAQIHGYIYSPSYAGATAVRRLTRQWRTSVGVPDASCPIRWHDAEGEYWFEVIGSTDGVPILREKLSSAEGDGAVIPLRSPE